MPFKLSAWAGLLALGLAVGLYASGSAAHAQSAQPTGTPPATASAAPAKPTALPTITLIPTFTPVPAAFTLWHGWQGKDADALTAIVQHYAALHPEVSITVRYISGDLKAQFQTAVQAQKGPDILLGPSPWTSELADANLIVPVSGRIDKTLQAQVADVGWGTVTYIQQPYGVPQSLQCLALYYNVSLAAKPPATFADLLSAAKGLTLSFDFYSTAGLFFGAGGALLDTNNGKNLLGADANAQELLRSYLTQVQSLYTAATPAAPGIPNAPPLAFDQNFRVGQSPYLIDGSWRLSDLRRYLGDNLHVAPLPTLDNGKSWSPLVQSQAFFLSANADDPHASAAFDFITFALNAESQAAFAAQAFQVPVNPQAKLTDPALAGFIQQCSTGTAIAPRPELAMYWSVLDAAVYAVTFGKVPPDQAATAAIHQITTNLTPTP